MLTRAVAALLCVLPAVACATPEPAADVSAEPVAGVTGGQVRGVTLDGGGAVFKGIPFAAPPVGDLRWRDPQPPEPWDGVRETTAFVLRCAQNVYFGPPGTGREDCLYLNVWNADWPATGAKPVMVWIHGGGNYAGSARAPAFDGESLARRGVVVVTINYRVGMFGFFSHPALTAESPDRASGNQGILDQVAALAWVQDNVTAFGGDPGNVTIFGESAGSLDVSVLMTSPLARGLFHKAIGQSGPVLLAGDPQTLGQAEARGVRYAAMWGVSADSSSEDLRAVPASAILESEDIETDLPPNLGIVVDGRVLPSRPADVFASGAQAPVPMIVGSNSGDMPPFGAPSDLAGRIRELYGPLAARAEALYVGADAAEQWTIDWEFRCPNVVQLVWHNAAGQPSYAYQFSRVAAGRDTPGAVHGSELNYVFGTLSAETAMPRGPVEFDDVDTAVSGVMQRYWTNFAKTGDPNGAGLPLWPRFDAEARAYVEFLDDGPVAGEGLRRPQCDLFMENLTRRGSAP